MRVQADMQLRVILSVLFSVPKLFPHLLLSSQQRIGRFFSRIPSRLSNRRCSIYCDAAIPGQETGAMRSCWSVSYDQRDTQSLPWKSESVVVVWSGCTNATEGPNQNSIIVALSFEAMNECQISCHLKHALGLSNIVNALNDATI